jgi:hypothetical protein
MGVEVVAQPCERAVEPRAHGRRRQRESDLDRRGVEFVEESQRDDASVELGQRLQALHDEAEQLEARELVARGAHLDRVGRAVALAHRPAGVASSRHPQSVAQHRGEPPAR